MRFVPRSLKWRAILLTLLGLVAVGGTAVYVWGRSLGSYVHNQLQIIRERDNAHPVTRGLARGEIRAGSSVEELIATHPPKHVDRRGRFVELGYANGPEVIAVDGKLAFARHGWCSHATVFFNQLTDDDATEYEALINAEYARLVDEARACHGSVAGVSGWMSHQPAYQNAAIEPPPVP